MNSIVFADVEDCKIKTTIGDSTTYLSPDLENCNNNQCVFTVNPMLINNSVTFTKEGEACDDINNIVVKLITNNISISRAGNITRPPIDILLHNIFSGDINELWLTTPGNDPTSTINLTSSITFNFNDSFTSDCDSGNCTYDNYNNVFDINIPIIRFIGGGTFNINVIDSQERNMCGTATHLTLKYNTIIIEEGTAVNLKIIPKDASVIGIDKGYSGSVKGCYGSATNTGEDSGDTERDYPTYGGDAHLLGNRIENNGTFNITLQGAKGGDGLNFPYYHINGDGLVCESTEKSECFGADGGKGGYGGYATFTLNDLVNNGSLAINLTGGNGGIGGRGINQSSDHKQHGVLGIGGNGGNGGESVFDVTNIYNTKNLNISLIAGNGSIGGKAGYDETELNDGECKDNTLELCQGELSDTINAGDGGYGGNIRLDPINYIYNSGSFTFSAQTGNGGDGGEMRHDDIRNYECYANCDVTPHGNGGNAGSVATITDSSIISGLNIAFLNNQSKNFTVNINGGTNGKGHIGKYEDITFPGSGNGILGSVNGIDLGILKSGSILPTSFSFNDDIYVLDYEFPFHVKGCYVKDPDNFDIFKLDKYISYKQLSGFDINILSYCPYCDAVTNVSDIDEENDLKNNPYRISDTYDLYSDVNGIIDVNNLKIYYAQNNSPFGVSIPFNLIATQNCKESADSKDSACPTIDGYDLILNNCESTFVDSSSISSPFTIYQKIYQGQCTYQHRKEVYINKDEIIPTYDEDLNLYVYEINQKNLQLMDPIYWLDYDHINYNLDPSDNLYCMAQQYYIEGTITKDNESIPFNFPFTPIFKN
jgi:hypothetical protein